MLLSKVRRSGFSVRCSVFDVERPARGSASRAWFGATRAVWNTRVAGFAVRPGPYSTRRVLMGTQVADEAADETGRLLGLSVDGGELILRDVPPVQRDVKQ
jgi:hypothetical protein